MVYKFFRVLVHLFLSKNFRKITKKFCHGYLHETLEVVWLTLEQAEDGKPKAHFLKYITFSLHLRLVRRETWEAVEVLGVPLV